MQLPLTLALTILFRIDPVSLDASTSLNQFLLLPETGGLTLKDRLMALEAQESTRPPRTRPVPPQEPDEKVRLVPI